MAYTLIQFIQIAANVFTILIIVRAVMSWISPDPNNPLVRFVVGVTEPVMGPIRNLLPAAGGIDFSPLIVLIGIQVLERILVRMLLGMA